MGKHAPTRATSAQHASIVFVIDDDDSVRRALSRLLRSAGLGIEAFGSAQAFLQREPPECPSCLVLDVRMPGLSGLDLQAELQRAGLEIPIVFITGHGDVPMCVHALKAGAADFLEKPFDDERLLDAVRAALTRDREAWTERVERQELRRRVDCLTPRERQVMELVISGLLNKQIGGRLGSSEKTVKVHRGRVMEKMQARSVPELLLMAQKVGIPASGFEADAVLEADKVLEAV